MTLLGWLASAGCGHPSPAATSGPASATASDPRAASCLATAPPEQRALSGVGPPVEIGERTFAYAWRWSPDSEVASVIVSLAADGSLIETPLDVPFADPKTFGVGPDELLMISVPMHGTGRLVRIAVGADGALVPGAAEPVPDVAWGWPSVLTSDGTRATLIHSLAAPDQTIASTVSLTIELASRKVIATGPAPSVEPREIKQVVASSFGQSERHPFRDGLIEVGWDGGHQLAHSPTDREVRRYFEHWQFTGGQVRLLRETGGRWTAIDPMPLPLHDANGTMHTGYTPVVLRHGAHAAVLLAPDGHDLAWFQPYRMPCPR